MKTTLVHVTSASVRVPAVIIQNIVLFCNVAYSLKSSFYSSHSRILAYLDRLPRGVKIVDLGCSSGYLARLIKERHDAMVVGVDDDGEALKEAERVCDRVVRADLEHPLPITDDDVDLVVMADVLEHVVHADDLMCELHRITHRASDPFVILSVPNVANIVIRLKLLLGHFSYTEQGILDRTHVRFYTKKSLLSFLEHHGVEVISISVTPIPLERVFPEIVKISRVFAVADTVLNGVTQMWRTLFGYQFVILGRVSNT